MKRTYQENKSLYESIMRDVAKIVKHHLNEMSPAVYSNASEKMLEKFIKDLSDDELYELSKSIFDYIEKYDQVRAIIDKISKTKSDELLNWAHDVDYKSVMLLSRILYLFITNSDLRAAFYNMSDIFDKYPKLKSIVKLKDHSEHIRMNIDQLLELGIIEDKGDVYKMTVKYDFFSPVTKYLNITFEDSDYNNVILAAVAVGKSFKILSKFGKETNIIKDYTNILKNKVMYKKYDNDHSLDYDDLIEYIRRVVEQKYGYKNLGQIIIDILKDNMGEYC